MAYFNAGPAKIPDDVLLEVESELLNYAGTGLSVMEISHRSNTFAQILNTAESNLRSLLNVPEDYAVLFVQGGATGQFAAVPLNLTVTGKADYIVTGTWSRKAADEAARFTKTRVVYENKLATPEPGTLDIDPDADFVYYCDNETIEGVEFGYVPEVGNVPLVVDMSSNILTRQFDIGKFGVIFAGAQKNLGTSGVTVVIARRSLISRQASRCPIILSYAALHKGNSLLNTPPCFSIYVLGKVLEWTKLQGGVEEMEKRCLLKSKMIYDRIYNSGGFYNCPVREGSQSRTTIRIQLRDCAQTENDFFEQAEVRHMNGLRGHRSVGGVRVAVFNSISVAQVETLVDFLEDFECKSRTLKPY